MASWRWWGPAARDGTRPGRSPRALIPEARGLERRQVLSTLAPAAAEVRAASAAGDDGFVPLFNGRSLSGWSNPFPWGRAIARGGEIRLASNKKFFEVTDATYRDFVLEAEARIPPGANSGIVFGASVRRGRVSGLQADVDNGDHYPVGGLWSDTRGWLQTARRRAPVHFGGWNQYRVEAIGGHVRIFVNGVQTVDYQAAPPDTAGRIALQDHGSPGVYRFRNLRIKDLGGGS